MLRHPFLRDAFLAERDAHCVRDAASPVMHAFGACAERIASPITAQRQLKHSVGFINLCLNYSAKEVKVQAKHYILWYKVIFTPIFTYI